MQQQHPQACSSTLSKHATAAAAHHAAALFSKSCNSRTLRPAAAVHRAAGIFIKLCNINVSCSSILSAIAVAAMIMQWPYHSCGSNKIHAVAIKII